MNDKRDLTRTKAGTPTQRTTSGSDVAAFLAKAKAMTPVTGNAKGKLIFALDATMSRQPTWDLACELQASMFDAVGSAGGLAVQLIYFRGFGECRASRWMKDAKALRDVMVKIDCRGGHTQIGKVLAHARKQASEGGLGALIYVGDAMEENADRLCQIAGELGLLGTRAFMFHEGRDAAAGRTFQEIARLTGGVYLPFDASAASELKALLGAVASYAAGGREALESRRDAASNRLLADMR